MPAPSRAACAVSWLVLQRSSSVGVTWPDRMLEVLQEDNEFHLAGSARIEVLVSALEPRQASQIVKELTELLPLEQAKLTHLKRIRRSQDPGRGKVLEVMLSPPDMYLSLDEAKRKDIEERYGLSPTVYAVPKLEPRTREQFKSGGAVWPMIFHHSTSEEARRAARAIPEQDMVNAVAFMREALQDATTGRQQNGGRATVGAVLVDPAAGRGRGRVVATASRERQHVHDEGPASMIDHPLHHAAMLCVQGVGRALAAQPQVGVGVGDEEEGKLPPHGEGAARAECAGRVEAAERAEGAGRVEGVEGQESVEVDSAEEKVAVEVPSSKQYLCTGYDLYITREPCLMCAMALVHSRVRRVIYGVRNPNRGCLGSVMMLHTLAPLNHNYRVFEDVCADDCRQSLTDQEAKPSAAVETSATA